MTKRGGNGSRGLFVSMAVALACASSAPIASDAHAADDKLTCADSYKAAQTQRKSGALRRARESLLVCMSDRCPAVLHPDCLRWLTEVEAAMPSLAFAAQGADGKDVTNVRVSLDGEVLTESLDGKAVAVDPGSHVLKFERAGEPPIEEPVVVREGEKSRVVSVSWAKTRAAVAPVEPATGAPTSSGAPASAWIFGGVGLAGVATFGTLAFVGMQRRSDLRDECFGACDQSRVDAIKTQLVLADVALGVGIVSLGVSAVLFLSGSSRGESDKPAAVSGTTARVGVAPTRGGGAVGLVGSF